MKVTYSESVKYKMLERLKTHSSNVVLRSDFADLGDYRQISRGLKALIANKELVKIAFGVYAKAYQSKYTDAPLIKGGTDLVFREALQRLEVPFEPGSAEQAYNAGVSTQVPVRNTVRLKGRCRRRISYRNSRLIFEGNINAK